jgi:3-isopropylmalate/(R)-2-methylmalate dehydratase small subunit
VKTQTWLDKNSKERIEIMEPFTKLTGIVAPLDRVNVDTDQIIPAVYLKRIERTGYGPFLFSAWRYREDGTSNPDFVLNMPAYQNANILVGGRNFGSGSSREHAPWALHDYGIRCVIAPSFADIFYNNCFQNGLLPVTLPEEVVRQIMDKAKASPGFQLNVDLEAQRIWDNDEEVSVSFQIDSFRRHCLLNGLDDIGLTLQHEDKIAAYEAGH